jgi:hypothetical protein
MGTLAWILIPAALLVVAVVAVLELRRRKALEPDRPWWGTPSFWVGVCAVFVLLGLFVFPRLLGFTFLLLPFVWLGGLGRRRREH